MRSIAAQRQEGDMRLAAASLMCAALVIASWFPSRAGDAQPSVTSTAPPRPAVCRGTSAGARTSTANVAAADSRGIMLPDDPALSGSQTLRLIASGFAPGAEVAIYLTSAAGDLSKKRGAADAYGNLTYAYSLPGLRDGHYELVVEGAPPTRRDKNAKHVPPKRGITISVTIPQTGSFPFRVGCSAPHVTG